MTSPHNAVQFAAQIFHRDAREWKRSVEVVEDEIAVNARHELKFLEAKGRLLKLELLRQSKRGTKREAARLRKLAQTLKSRDYWEEQLAPFE